MKRRYLLLFFACFFAFVGAFAQHENNVQTVRGTVVDETTQYPLVGALVGVVDYPELSAISNEQGEFVIYDVPLGRQSFEITYVGYKTERIENVLLVSGKETHLNVALEENVVVTERVVVTARKVQPESLNEMATVSARAISVEQTERFAGSLGDPARMVANYAGVSSKDDSRNDIIIRGNSPIGVLWRLDGVEIPNPNHFATLGATGGPVGMINNNLLATSDFLIGAFPAEYGNATAGVFDLHLRPGNTFTHEFVGQVGFNGFEFGAEGPLSTDKNIRPSYLINFRYSTLEVMNMLGMDFGTGAAIPEYKDVTYNITIPTENKGLFKVFGLWGDSFIQLGREENAESNSYNAQGTATDFGSETGVFAGSHTYFFNKNMRLRSTASFQYTTVNTDFDSASNSGVYKPMFRQRQYQTKVSVHQKLISKISSALTFSAGYVYDMIDVDYIDSTFQGSETGFVTGIDIQEPMNLVQSYIQAQYKPLRNIKIYAGAHSQYFDVNSQMVIEPRAGIEFYLPHSQYIKLGYGVHNQTQIPEIYFLRKYDAQQQLYEYTNKNVKFTRNNHYVVSYGISF
ncbi:MAG: carboxypeptidase regulatory-like domain-containing protein [Bacteroidota bacterium]